MRLSTGMSRAPLEATGTLQSPELVTGLPPRGLKTTEGHEEGEDYHMEEEGTGSGGLRPSAEDPGLSAETPRGGPCRRPLGARGPAFVFHTDPRTKRQRRMSAGSGEAGGKYQPRGTSCLLKLCFLLAMALKEKKLPSSSIEPFF